MNNLWRVEWDCWWTLCLQKSPIKWTGFSLYQNSHAILWYIMSYNSLLSKIKTLIKLLDPNLDNSVWKKPLKTCYAFYNALQFLFPIILILWLCRYIENTKSTRRTFYNWFFFSILRTISWKGSGHFKQFI